MQNNTNQYDTSKTETGRAVIAALAAIKSGRTTSAELEAALGKLDTVLGSYEDNAECSDALASAEAAAETAWEAVVSASLAR
jgi:hypothetical protein